jgi:myo-inositol 2-dehydrogenase/D-chiro-inositol 1-dehydrogenase
MPRTVRVGVIGAGRIGRLHLENLARRIPEARAVAVSDLSIAAAQKCAADLGIAKVTENHQELLADGTIEAVVICSSTDTHAQTIIEAAAQKKHIFCEKPIALDLDPIDRALEAVDASGVKLQIGFNRRFDPNNIKLVKIIREGKIGDLDILRITSRDPAPPPMEYVKVSGGIFLDMTIHDFDLARYLVGAEVEEVLTMAAVRGDPAIGKAGDQDTAVLSLRFANGVIGRRVLKRHPKKGSVALI